MALSIAYKIEGRKFF